MYIYVVGELQISYLRVAANQQGVRKCSITMLYDFITMLPKPYSGEL